MAKSIAEQVIVIVGASSGIGLATAKAAAHGGAKVVLSARNGPALERAAGAIRRRGGDANVVVADVTRPADLHALVDATLQRHGRIDTFVNAVGVSVYGTSLEIPIEDYRRTMDVVFLGHVNAAKAALPALEHTAGALVCIGSVLSDRGFPLQGPYCAAKHALKGWLDSLRVELRHAGSAVRITLVKPATMDTPLFAKARTYLGVEPRGIPPVYAPELAASAILRAAEGNARDVYVGGAGKLLSIGERLAPGLVDLTLQPRGWSLAGQRTRRAKTADAPNNLYQPMPDDDGGIRGNAETRVRTTSLYQALSGHPIAGPVALAAGLTTAGYAARAITPRRVLGAMLGLAAMVIALRRLGR